MTTQNGACHQNGDHAEGHKCKSPHQHSYAKTTRILRRLGVLDSVGAAT